MSRTEARVPAFWRVVLVGDDGRRYMTARGSWSTDIICAGAFPKLDAELHARKNDGRVVPVYVTVRKVQRGHDFAWALRQMRQGKRVRRMAWSGCLFEVNGCCRYSATVEDRLSANADYCPEVRDLFATDWVLAEAAK